jgi:hypothetical protein
MVSESVIVNLRLYCLFTIILILFELDIDKLVMGLGERLLTKAEHVSSLEPDIYDVILIESDGCPVGGDKKLFIEKLNVVET